MEAARFLWWMAAAALVLPFLDLVQRTIGPQQWLDRATRERVLLGVLEVGTLLAWLAVQGRWRFLPEQDPGVAVAGAVLALTGALFAAWGKARLGSLFSPHLGVQEGHRLVTTGPYAVVRHPIYLGLIDFLIGSALYFNDVALLSAAFLFVIWFTAQIRIEERFFAAHFGEEWLEYQARTPALFPRVLPRRPKS
ncbi:MAG TPA: isoprenylcysteine carboxylmethyltransferase family protein [Longimicrobiales bacterium]|nr:isoprenylcysteine carboxylmethyltransferase family protein [Longimicrobiales bacterium]